VNDMHTNLEGDGGIRRTKRIRVMMMMMMIIIIIIIRMGIQISNHAERKKARQV
jgi:hypothetical protein